MSEAGTGLGAPGSAGTSEPVLNHNTHSGSWPGRTLPLPDWRDYICCLRDCCVWTLILSSRLLLITRLVVAAMSGMRVHWKIIPGPGAVSGSSLVSYHDGILSHLSVSSHPPAITPCSRLSGVVTSIWLGTGKKWRRISWVYWHFSSQLSWRSDWDWLGQLWKWEILIGKPAIQKFCLSELMIGTFHWKFEMCQLIIYRHCTVHSLLLARILWFAIFDGQAVSLSI